jgi:diguanylate cyclase (GGDEF)-like protein
MYKQAIDSAMRDGLTGLNNRAAFDNSMNREIELAHRHNTPLSLVVLDIDHFKKINDSYGHSYGDKALKQLADTINDTMRGSDIAFRYGGEEFTLVLSNTDAKAAKNVANRLRVAVSQLCCEDEKHTFGYTISLGIAQLEADDTAFSLFDKADKALYEAKEAGRNAICCA